MSDEYGHAAGADVVEVAVPAGALVLLDCGHIAGTDTELHGIPSMLRPVYSRMPCPLHPDDGAVWVTAIVEDPGPLDTQTAADLGPYGLG